MVRLIGFVVWKRIGCKHVQAIYCHEGSKVQDIQLAGQHLVGDELCTPQRLPGEQVCASVPATVCIEIILPLKAMPYSLCHLLSNRPHVSS